WIQTWTWLYRSHLHTATGPGTQTHLGGWDMCYACLTTDCLDELSRGGQTKTWQKSMKSLTSGLSHVGRCRLRGWGPRDESHQWLETLNDMAQNRSQWRRCIHSL
ncbi:kinase C-binding 1, partial [Schistosoma japonicum]